LRGKFDGKTLKFTRFPLSLTHSLTHSTHDEAFHKALNLCLLIVEHKHKYKYMRAHSSSKNNKRFTMLLVRLKCVCVSVQWMWVSVCVGKKSKKHLVLDGEEKEEGRIDVHYHHPYL